MRGPGGWVLVLVAGLAMACGGGGSSGPALPPAAPPRPSPALPPGLPTDLPLHIEGLYITQGSQRMDRSVPLVQGKAGFLRVFVLAKAWSGPAPAVRVLIQDRNGNVLLNKELPAPDYDCRKILAFRAGEPLAEARHLASREEDCLLVRGMLRQGRAELEAAFQVRREPLPPEPGGYLLTALDAHGAVLASAPFAPEEIEDEDDPGLGAFAFVIPMTRAMQDGLATLRVSRNGETLGERHAAGRGLRGDDPRPHAGRDGHGLVHLVWDPQAHPEVLVKDARTGEVLSMGAGGRLALETRAHELECLFSDGLRTLARRVPVQ